MTWHGQAVVLDTNLLLLLLAGTTDLSLFRTFKRVQSFSIEDYLLLLDVVSAFPALLTTPHILAETSNFVDQCPPYRHAELVQEFKYFVSKVEEVTTLARELIERPNFGSLGLTDTAVSALSHRALVLTADYELAGRITADGGACRHFSDLRSTRRL